MITEKHGAYFFEKDDVRLEVRLLYGVATITIVGEDYCQALGYPPNLGEDGALRAFLKNPALIKKHAVNYASGVVNVTRFKAEVRRLAAMGKHALTKEDVKSLDEFIDKKKELGPETVEMQLILHGYERIKGLMNYEDEDETFLRSVKEFGMFLEEHLQRK